MTTLTSVPHRSAIEALVATLDPDEPCPRWARCPGDETQFAAALIGRWSHITPVYDANGYLIAYRGIRRRGSV